MCVCVVAGLCHSVPVSEIISVREDEQDSSRPSDDDDDGSWKKIREGEGKDCRQAFTGKPGQHEKRGSSFIIPPCLKQPIHRDGTTKLHASCALS